MSLIRGFTNQTITLEARSGVDPRTGEPSYSEPQKIPARYERRQRKVINSDGSEVVADTEVLLQAEPAVNIGDKIEGRTVMAVEDIRAKNGKLLGYTALL